MEVSREGGMVVTRHIWEAYMETCEDIRYTLKNDYLPKNDFNARPMYFEAPLPYFPSFTSINIEFDR